MVKGSVGALALVLSQALWVLPAARPAEAQVPSSCYLPPFTPLVSPCVPHDVPAGPAATVADLAVFAWQEFIALNWVAMDPATTGMRGRPNTSIDIPGFLGVKPDSTGNYPLVVWQTYRHKNELFPADGVTDATFDSRAPTYKYRSPVPTPAPGQLPSFQLFNNLDETSQIGLDFMFAHATSNVEPPISGNGSGPATGIRVAYEAKVNRAVFDYANKPPLSLTNPNNNYRNLSNALGQTFSNLPTVGGTCNVTSTQPIVELPCGDLNVPGDPGEGAIEIKAAWRALTPTEISGGKFFTRKVIYYTGPQGNQRYNNEVWGLIALHIIHKTKSFPAFVFASWEQVDNYDDSSTTDPNAQISVISGSWAIPLFCREDSFAVLRAEAARLQQVETAHLALLRSLPVKARVRIWTLAEFLENPMENLQAIIDEISPRLPRRLSEAPRMVSLDGFGQFLQNLKNQGMQPTLMGDFPVSRDWRPAGATRGRPYLVR